MCLSIPAKILSFEEGEMAKVDVRGVEALISLQLVDDLEIGDYVLVHTGFALQKLSVSEAAESLRILDEMDDALNEPEQ